MPAASVHGRTLTSMTAERDSPIRARNMWSDPPPPPAFIATEPDITAEIEVIRAEIEGIRHARHQASIDELRREEISRIVTATIEESVGRRFENGRPWNGISSDDGSFTLDFDFYTQSSWCLNQAPDEVTEKGFQVDSVRLTFSGTIIDPTWSYQTRLLFLPGSSGQLQFGLIQKDLGDGFSIRAGFMDPAMTLEESIDNNQQLGVCLSFTAGQWDAESVPGVNLTWTSDSLRGWVDCTNAWGGNNDGFSRNQRQLIIARGEWKPFGDWDDLYDFNPYPESTEPGMLVGFGAAQSWGATAIGTPDEYSGSDQRLSADLSLQRPGIGGMASISWQSNVPGAPIDGGGDRLAVVSQCGWFIDPTIEVYGRGEWGRTIDVEADDLVVTTIGASWMPRSNRMIKFSLEFMRMWGDARYWKIDGDPGIRTIDQPQSIVRAQLQLSV